METGSGVVEWSDEHILNLVDDGVAPDFWVDSMPVTYGLLQKIYEGCSKPGKVLKYALPNTLSLLKPSVNITSIPPTWSIKTQLQRKKNLAHPNNPVPWLEKQDPDYIGPLCEEHGIRLPQLFAEAQQPQITPVSNGIILELRLLMQRKQFTWANFSEWLIRLNITSSLLSPNSVCHYVSSLFEKKTKLTRSKKHEEKDCLLLAVFCIVEKTPLSECESLSKQLHRAQEDNEKLQKRCDAVCSKLHSVREDRNMLLEELHDLDKALNSLLGDLSTTGSEKDRLAKQLSDLELRYEKCCGSLEASRKQMSAWNLANFRRRENRRDKKIAECCVQISNLQSEREEKLNEKEGLDGELSQKVSTITALRKQVAYYKNKSIHHKLMCDQQKHDLYVAQRRLMEKEEEMRDVVQKYTDDTLNHLSIPIMVDGRYSNDLRATVMELHSLGLGFSNVEQVLRVVSQRLFNVTLPTMPSATTMKQFVLESNLLGKLQVGRALLHGVNNTLHCDGTTDHQHHYLGFQVSQPGSSLTMAMVETERGDTDTHTEQLKQILSDCIETIGGTTEGKTEMFDKMILSLKNTMTDQHIVNKKFREDIEELRRRSLEKSLTHWNDLTTETQNNLVSINQFFCLLHVLLGIAEACEAALKEYESIVTQDGKMNLGRHKLPDMKKRDLSSTSEAVKAACALFSSLGHPSAGVPQDFAAYLHSKGKACQFKQYNHARFNILGENSVAYIHHLEDIRGFLQLDSHDNQLVKAVAADCSDDVLVSLVLSVALLHKFVTAPFHAIVLNTEIAVHMLDINPILHNVQTALEELSQDPGKILNPSFKICEEMKPFQKGMFAACHVTNTTEGIDVTLECLSLICTAALVTYTRQVKHQLPGGRLAEVTEELRNETDSVPKSNAVGESQFALLKFLRGFKPNASLPHMEATILWAYNKTGDWLYKCTPEEREELFNISRKKTPQFQKVWKSRQLALRTARLQTMREKVQKKEEKEKRDSAAKQKAVDGVVDVGGQCRTVEDVDIMVQNCSTAKEVAAALKAQLTYYKKIITPSSVKVNKFYVTSKGKPLPNNTLQSNLKYIITQHLQNIQQQPATANSFIPDSNIRQHQLSQSKKAFLVNYTRQVPQHSAGPVRGKKRKEPMPNLVGKRIMHRWAVNSRNKWFTAKVLLKHEPGTAVATYKEDECSLVAYDLYDVQYDGEDMVHTLNLEKDWIREDLEIQLSD